jgi:rsbT co-antagonist protein RsbR
MADLPRIDLADGTPDALQRILDALPDPVFAKDRAHRFIAFNAAFCRLLGRAREALLGHSDPEFFPPEQVEVFWRGDDAVFAGDVPTEIEEKLSAAAGLRTIWTRKQPLRGPDGAVVGLVGVITDVTELEARTRDAERALQESAVQREQLAAQAAVLDALTMPVVEVGERVLLVPLVGELSARRFARAIDDLLATVTRVRARVVLFDLTGVPSVDTAVAGDLLRALRAAALLGCRGALCGIRPEIARTLIALAVDFGDLRTYASVRLALADLGRLAG